MQPDRSSSSTAEAGGAKDRTPGSAEPAVAKPTKKPYARPCLKYYGALVDITQFGGSQFVDSGGGLGNQP
jgi:hypothetical protein